MDHKRPHTADNGHLTQSTRALRALDTDYFRPDERNLADLINTATELSRLLTYFDENDQAHHPSKSADCIGAWEAFFREDITFLLAQIASVNVRAEFRASRLEDAQLEPLIISHATRLWSWHQRAQDLAVFAPEDSLEAALFSTLDQPQESDLKGLIPSLLMDKIRKRDVSVPNCWQANTRVDHYPYATVFSTLSRVTAQIGNAAEQYLELSLADKNDHEAHVGLFLAFVRLLQKSQIELNKITDRHLEFYFRKVLRSNPREAQPDHAHIIFELAPGALPENLSAGTALVAGSGSGPDAAIFETERPLVVTSARALAFKAVAIDRDPDWRDRNGTPFVEGASVYPVANSADGKGAPLPDPSIGWSPFGPEKPDAALIGLALASPVFNLTGGQRSIEVKLCFDDQCRITLNEALIRYRDAVNRRYEGQLSERRFRRFLNDAFRLSLTSATGFHAITDFVIDPSDSANNNLALRFTLSEQDPPITAWTAIHNQPLLKIELDPKARAYAYSAFHKARLIRAGISVKVEGLNKVKVTANGAPVKPGKPFAPFGPAPLPGAHMTIHASELADKEIHSLGVRMAWTGLPTPPADLASHYAGYGADIANDSFRASLSKGDDQTWWPLKVMGPGDPVPGSDATLFPMATNEAIAIGELRVPTLPGDAQTGSGHQKAAKDAALSNFRIVLTSPEMGFGTQIFPRLVAKAAISNAEGTIKKTIGLLGKLPTLKKPKKAKMKPPKIKPPKAAVPDGDAAIPNPPLQPMLSGLTISYTATTTAQLPGSNQSVTLLSLGAFGEISEVEDGQFIQSDLNADGRLMIGLDRANPPEPLTLFFNIRDSRASNWTHDNVAPRPGLYWSYFSNTGWRILPDIAIIADGTEELTTHGIVEIALPADMEVTNRYSDNPLAWISIGYQGDRARFGKVIDIKTQAVSVRRRPLAPTVITPALLPAGSIKRFFSARPAVAKITQPLATEGGRSRETTTMHRTRLSERLGHKMRAIRQMDYARMVLEAFPDLGDVKCRHLDAGRVELIVSPRRSKDRTQRCPRVALHTRSKIARWLEAHTPLTVGQVDIRNPAYEDIRVQAHLVPLGAGTAVTLAQVENNLFRLIAPWMFEPSLPLPIGHNELEIATITAAIEKMPGISRVLGLSLVHSYRNRGANGGDTGRFGIKDSARAHQARQKNGAAFLRGATPASVFVPALHHDISFLPPRDGIGDLTIGRDLVASDPKQREAYRNEPSELPYEVAPTGIGSLCIGRDLIITDPVDAIPPSSELEIRPHPLDAVFLTK
ncbi:hypothetical protein [uncultured Roseovarius sp.]|uniref:hypothetical protein n=1 Tax=uncultured Roseovarius sp. TaxID=293344 RepID=UPI002621B400|nr:hypothetical protein [uncultured Roseovarius sp.]